MAAKSERAKGGRERPESKPTEASTIFEFTGKGDAACLCSVGARMCLDGCFSISCTGAKVVESYITTGYRRLANPADYELESHQDELITTTAVEDKRLGRGACLCSPASAEMCTAACNSMSCFGAEVVKQYLK